MPGDGMLCTMQNRRLAALRFQAGYYVATGVWPLVSRRTFEAVTGRKQDWWLVQMVGALALVNGIAIAIGTREGRSSRETQTLSILTALAFATIDTVYALKRRIRPIYLGDAVAEAVLIWAIAVTPP